KELTVQTGILVFVPARVVGWVRFHRNPVQPVGETFLQTRIRDKFIVVTPVGVYGRQIVQPWVSGLLEVIEERSREFSGHLAYLDHIGLAVDQVGIGSGSIGSPDDEVIGV